MRGRPPAAELAMPRTSIARARSEAATRVPAMSPRRLRDMFARHFESMELTMALEIIGAGFGRTGTNSLKIALEHLGFGPCHHMFEVRDNPECLPDWEKAANDERVDWDQVFQNYRSQVDWPGARYWRELAGHFPNAKVILSVREPDAWFDSVQATIAPFLAARGKHGDPHVNAIAEMAYKTIVVPAVRRPIVRAGSCDPRFRESYRRGSGDDTGRTSAHVRPARRLGAAVHVLARRRAGHAIPQDKLLEAVQGARMGRPTGQHAGLRLLSAGPPAGEIERVAAID